MDRGDRAVLAEKLTNEIEQEILSLKKKEISSDLIRDLTLKTLRKSDPTMFLSFLAYFGRPSLRDLKKQLTTYLHI